MLTNGYYALLLSLPWTLKEWDGPMQFEDPSGKLMMLPSDIALIQDKKMRQYVQMYAKDKELFFKEFAAAMVARGWSPEQVHALVNANRSKAQRANFPLP